MAATMTNANTASWLAGKRPAAWPAIKTQAIAARYLPSFASQSPSTSRDAANRAASCGGAYPISRIIA
jgi:hypothetical protein